MPDSWYADLPAQFCSVPTYFLSLAWFGKPHRRTPSNSACVLGSVCGAEPLTTHLHVAIDISRQNSKPVRHAHRWWRLSPTHFTFTRQSIHGTKPPRIVSCTRPVARTPLCLDDPICLFRLLLLTGPGIVQTCFPFAVCLCGSPCPLRPFPHPSACIGPFGDHKFHSGRKQWPSNPTPPFPSPFGFATCVLDLPQRRLFLCPFLSSELRSHQPKQPSQSKCVESVPVGASSTLARFSLVAPQPLQRLRIRDVAGSVLQHHAHPDMSISVTFG